MDTLSLAEVQHLHESSWAWANIGCIIWSSLIKKSPAPLIHLSAYLISFQNNTRRWNFIGSVPGENRKPSSPSVQSRVTAASTSCHCESSGGWCTQRPGNCSYDLSVYELSDLSDYVVRKGLSLFRH